MFSVALNAIVTRATNYGLTATYCFSSMLVSLMTAEIISQYALFSMSIAAPLNHEPSLQGQALKQIRSF